VAIETVVNGTTIIINEQSDPSWLIYLAIALITLVGIIWTNLQTKKSNELLEYEIHSKIRPWIVLSETKPRQIVFSDNSVRYYEEWSVNPTKFPSEIKEIIISMLVKNSGTVPARQFEKRVGSSHNILTKDSFAKIPPDELSSTLMPNQEQRVGWHIPWNDWENRLSNPLYFGALIRYKINNTDYEDTGLIVKIGLGGTHVVESW
jgi:hypothetical protein